MDNSAMQGVLKVIVITLGLLIVIGLGMLFYGFVKLSEDPDWRLFGSPPKSSTPKAQDNTSTATTTDNQAVTPSAPALAISGDISLKLPSGCEVTAVNSAGGKIFVLTGPRSDTDCGHVLILDPALGKIVGRLIP